MEGFPGNHLVVVDNLLDFDQADLGTQVGWDMAGIGSLAAVGRMDSRRSDPVGADSNFHQEVARKIVTRFNRKVCSIELLPVSHIPSIIFGLTRT